MKDINNAKIIVVVGYSQAECEFSMDDGVALWRHLETLLRHSTENKLEITLKRVCEEPVEDDVKEVIGE